MADQPIPDFSQNQQFAPGFQPQMPIPGISSSFPQQQQQFQQFPQTNSILQQQADQIAVQSMVTSRTTMALAQQNLMQSMHTAMLGTMGAFSDISRRGGAMITSMSPAGRYNDMLAPNQNWALESSFRREMGFSIGNHFNLDPHNSVMSRLIQGRRPEFLTEGEYGATMGIAHQMRVGQFEKGAASAFGSTALSMMASAGGLSFGASIALPLVGGLIIDRALEASYAEQESKLKYNLNARTKRVGIGQQFINSREMEKVHTSFYEHDNPYARRYFGDNALGNLWKPDIEKLKVFDQMKDNGLMSFEKLDSDSILKYINKVTDAVEKFSRIGKLTHEASVKIMSQLKGAGIHGQDMLDQFKDIAHQSNLTGIDAQTLTDIRAGAASSASGLGFNATHSSQSMGNILSSFVMMQTAGNFRGKNVMDLTQNAFQYNMQNTRNTLGMITRFGGIGEAFKGITNEYGGGDAAWGAVKWGAADHNVGDLDMIRKELAAKAKAFGGDDFKAFQEMMASAQGDPTRQQTISAVYHGMDKITETSQKVFAHQRLQGRESTAGVFDVRDIAAYKENREDPNKYQWTKRLFGTKESVGYDFNAIIGRMTGEGSDTDSTRRRIMYGELKTKVLDYVDKNSNVNESNTDHFTYNLLKVAGINPYNGEFNNQQWQFNLGYDQTPKQVLLAMLQKERSNLYKKVTGISDKGDDTTADRFSRYRRNLSSMPGMNGNFEDVTSEAVSFVKYLVSKDKRQEFTDAILRLKDKTNNLTDLSSELKDVASELGLDPSEFKPFLGDEGNQNLISLFTGLDVAGQSYLKKRRIGEREIAKRAGFMKGDQIDYNALEKGYKPLSAFRKKYLDEAGAIKKEYLGTDGGIVSSEFKSDLLKLWGSKDADVKKALRFQFGEDLYGRRDSYVKDKGAMLKGEAEAITQRFIVGNNLPDESTLKEIIKSNESTIAADPSDDAIQKLNKLLGKIVDTMDKQTPKKKE
jgi:AraC-like DNA-binding protein